MGSEIELLLLVISGLVFGVLSGTYAAVEILSWRYTERNGDDVGDAPRFIDRLLENPVNNHLSLGLGRIITLALLVFFACRLAAAYLFDGNLLAPGLFVVVLLSLFVPLVSAKLVALRDPDGYVERMKFVTWPVIYLLKPIVLAGVSLLKRAAPGLLDGLSFPVLPFKRRIELYGYRDGEEEMDEQQLVSSVFDFGDTKVREVMVPRIDMVAVNVHTNPDEALNLLVEAGHSRIPVYDDSIDKMVGVVHTKDVLEKIADDQPFTLSDIMREVYFVPESKMIDDLLAEFKKRRIHIAIAVDEYGGTAGMVTLEDVLEELVGDIQDEFDSEEVLIREVDEDTILCSARIRLDELDETAGIDLEEGDADTLGGFLYEAIGRVPRVGEVFETRGLEFRIESVVRQRIDEVRIKGLKTFERNPDTV
jgi:CBS domain containing-hemolysin-like protein